MAEVAAMWHRSPATIRRIFKNEKGVQHLKGMGLLVGTAKQSYDTMTIPQSVAERVYLRMQQPPAKQILPKRKLPKAHLRPRKVA